MSRAEQVAAYLAHDDIRACEKELMASPRYDTFRCKPVAFVCSCGRVFVHVCDEAEGCYYVVSRNGDR